MSQAEHESTTPHAHPGLSLRMPFCWPQEARTAPKNGRPVQATSPGLPSRGSRPTPTGNLGMKAGRPRLENNTAVGRHVRPATPGVAKRSIWKKIGRLAHDPAMGRTVQADHGRRHGIRSILAGMNSVGPTHRKRAVWRRAFQMSQADC